MLSISADSYYGARHGLETLFQLVLWDDVSMGYIMSDNVSISDDPAYSHRGFSLDTVRNFMPIEKIKEVLFSI